MKNKIIVIKMCDEVFLFESEHITREHRIIIESILDALWSDYEDEVSELSQFELLDWVLEKIKTETGIELQSIGIDCEFTICRE